MMTAGRDSNNSNNRAYNCSASIIGRDVKGTCVVNSVDREYKKRVLKVITIDKSQAVTGNLHIVNFNFTIECRWWMAGSVESPKIGLCP